MATPERIVPIKILGHWKDARVHVTGGDLFIDIPAELIRQVEARQPGRGEKFGYQLLIERYRIVDLVQGRPRRRASYIGECPECGAQAGLHALSCSRFPEPSSALESARSPRPLTEAALAELRALPPSSWEGWPPADYDQGLPVVEIRQDHLRALLAEVEERRRG